LPSDILAAVLFAQLESLKEIDNMRARVAGLYRQRLSELSMDGRIELPFVPENCQSNNHMFYILTRDQKTRGALIDYLKYKGILAVFHYVPLHNSPMGKKLGCDDNDLPVTQSVSERLLRLPLYCDLCDSDVDRICDEIVAFYQAE